jgi:carboxyl-terminal processing protease
LIIKFYYVGDSFLSLDLKINTVATMLDNTQTPNEFPASNAGLFQETSENLSFGKRNVWLPLTLSATMIIGILVGMKLRSEPLITKARKTPAPSAPAPNADPTGMGQGRIEELLRYINAKYIDKVSDKKLVEGAINNLLEELDPHSHYIPAGDMDAVHEDLDGEMDGVGLQYLIADDTLIVETPLSGSPAESSGLMSGDRIVSIDDFSLTGAKIDYKSIGNRLRGKKGTKLRIGYVREGEIKIRQAVITREKVSSKSIDVLYPLDEKTVYLRINRFSSTTYKEFMNAMNKLPENGKRIQDIVFDLRQNPGGYMEQAVDILSQLFDEKDKLLVYTQGRTIHKTEYKTTGRNYFDLQKVAVLIDEGSASASEIMAGAVQDWDRGVIIGRRSFGKGLVQEQYPLKDGSALRLTVARYFTPSKRSIQKPYKGKTRKEYDAEETTRVQNGELSYADSIKYADTTKYFTAGGRIVRGGGGIVPDIFVPMESVQQSEYYHKLRQLVPEFSYRYVITHRKELQNTKLPDLVRYFKINDVVFNDFLAFAERKQIPKERDQINLIKEPIKLLLKARIAKQYFGEEGYFTIMNAEDDCVVRAIQTLKSPDPLGLQKHIQKK